MLNSACKIFLTGLTFAGVSTAVSAENTTILQHNPFTKPEILAAPPPQAIRNKKAMTADVLPRLSAILLSDSLPMVIADDKLLSPGEAINDYQLLSVGKTGAVFEKQGKKYIVTLEDFQAETEQRDNKQGKNNGTQNQSIRRQSPRQQSTRRK